MDKIAQKSPLPHSICPSPNNVGFRSLTNKTLCMCGRGGGGERGGGLSRMCLKPCFPACGKKNTGLLL